MIIPATPRNENVMPLLNEWRAVYDGDNWTGENFAGKLSAIDEKLAFTQPFKAVHSVAEVLWHCIYWRTVLIRRLEGDHQYKARTAQKLNFLSIEDLKKKGWGNILTEFAATQTGIANLLMSKTNTFMHEIYEGDRSYYMLIRGMIEHEYYHLGQIGLIITILKVQNDSRAEAR